MSTTNKPKAFISCSVREEDQKFNTLVEKIVRKYGFEPCGTVGRHVNYAEPIPISMKREIDRADIVVIAATKRYIQSDIKGQNQQHAIPEMLHVESGMAYYANKPTVVFAQENVNLGGFIPNITQYFIIDNNFRVQAGRQLQPFFQDLKQKIANCVQNENFKVAKNVVVGGLAAYGAWQLIKNFFSNEK
ncbi:hypothetical protein [Marinifilum flexuosum]|uniref:hypothetical protein n=1 Tax=Marinifilum flexuosum TaxID=1117708 RepID=UPI0024940BB3|nr:hypothetical protein [Marinifilum flexuosum]